jgi:hypothetical protein
MPRHIYRCDFVKFIIKNNFNRRNNQYSAAAALRSVLKKLTSEGPIDLEISTPRIHFLLLYFYGAGGRGVTEVLISKSIWVIRRIFFFRVERSGAAALD